MTTEKIRKSELCAKVAASCDGVSKKLVTTIYDAFIAEIYKAAAEGKVVSLTGFGSFYLTKHKGHPVRCDKGLSISDYVLFKFSTSNVLNSKFREDYALGKCIVSEDLHMKKAINDSKSKSNSRKKRK